jgi:hypothetical protein
VGLPGTGKTSLARAIAHATGRAFGRLSLAGLSSEYALRGTRRTTREATPGLLLQTIAETGAADPLILLHEFDKAGCGVTGTLLEILDPLQSVDFHDHYVAHAVRSLRGHVRGGGQLAPPGPSRAARPHGDSATAGNVGTRHLLLICSMHCRSQWRWQEYYCPALLRDMLSAMDHVSADEPDISKLFAEGTQIDRAIRKATIEAVRAHKAAGNPVATWQAGKVVWIAPEQLVIEDDESHGDSS